MSLTLKIFVIFRWTITISAMISENTLRFLALSYYLTSYALAFFLWFESETHMILFGWTIFFFNTYQICTELHLNQFKDEI